MRPAVWPWASGDARPGLRRWLERTLNQALEILGADPAEWPYGPLHGETVRPEDLDALADLGAAWGWAITVTHLLPEGDPPSPSVQRLDDPPLRGIRRRLQERLQEAGLPDPVTEHDYNLPPPTRSRLVFLVGLAVGAGAALDPLWLDGRKAAERN